MITVVPYDISWKSMFEEEASKIKKVLGENCINIHHIGSTSIPGLAAKPLIDMIPVVKDIWEVDAANKKMKALGYEAKGEYGIAFRRYFQKGSPVRTYHLHVFEKDNPEIEKYLKFRNWMATSANDREAYAHLKQELAKKYPYDMMKYCLGKAGFITAISRKIDKIIPKNAKHPGIH